MRHRHGRNRSPVVSVVVSIVGAAAVVVATVARADDVVMTNGKTLTGRIVSEDSKLVKIETAGGSVTLDRALVREVRRGPVPEKAPEKAIEKAPEKTKDTKPAPKTPGPGPSDVPAAESGRRQPPRANPDPQDDIPVEARDRPPYRPPSLDELVATLEAIRLAPWTPSALETFELPASRVNTWRIEAADGRVTYARRSPTSPEGVARVWYLERYAEPSKDGVLRFGLWHPMAWRRLGRLWVRGPQEFCDYVDDEEVAGQVVRCVTSADPEAWSAAHRIRFEMQRIVFLAPKGTAPDLTEQKQALLAATTKATGSEDSGRAAARILEIEAAAMTATPEGKIHLATERRELVRRLVANAKAAARTEPAAPR